MNVASLWEFQGDDIDKFEGYQFMEDQEEQYKEWEHRKKIPKKGPIPLEKKKGKKKPKKDVQKKTK